MSEFERKFFAAKDRMCGRKKRYTSEREAADTAYIQRLQEGIEYDAYKCPFCHYWHVGHAKS